MASGVGLDMRQLPDEPMSGSLPACDEWPGTYPVTANPELLTIGEMARESGATARALRFYEGKGLLSPQRQGAARLYGRAERARLALVLKAKRLGFTLVEIRRMLEDGAASADGCGLSMSRRQCLEQIRLLEDRRREIETALVELRRTYSSFYVGIASASA